MPNSIGLRISEIITEAKLTKTAFGERINVSQGFVSKICSGVSDPSDRTISDICREFNVNEAWLRTGEGEMFRPVSRDEEISAFTEKVLSSQSSDFKRCFVSALARLDENAWELLEAFALSIVENRNQD